MRAIAFRREFISAEYIGRRDVRHTAELPTLNTLKLRTLTTLKRRTLATQKLQTSAEDNDSFCVLSVSRRTQRSQF